MRFYDLFYRAIYGNILRIIGYELEAEKVQENESPSTFTCPGRILDDRS